MEKAYTVGPCPGGLYYKTFYGHNLRVFVCVPGKPFQASLMFAGKAGTYPNEALSGAPL